MKITLPVVIDVDGNHCGASCDFLRPGDGYHWDHAECALFDCNLKLDRSDGTYQFARYGGCLAASKNEEKP